MKYTFILNLICILISSISLANTDHHQPVKVSTAFEDMKALVGTWEGKTMMDGKEESVMVTYHLTSGGTAIEEKLMPGTSHEMITMYANRKNDVHAIHYCMLGNQPEMKLKNSDKSTFRFEMIGTKGISNKNEMHMHSVTLTLNNKSLKQEWINFKDGKKGEVAVFEFVKK